MRYSPRHLAKIEKALTNMVLKQVNNYKVNFDIQVVITPFITGNAFDLHGST